MVILTAIYSFFKIFVVSLWSIVWRQAQMGCFALTAAANALVKTFNGRRTDF